jgi:hypothetical protein
MEWAMRVTFLPLYPRESAPVSIVRQARWAPGPITKVAEKISSVFQATTEPQIVRKTSRRQVECLRSFFFLRVLKRFSCLSEGRVERKKGRKKERKKERKKLTVLEFVFFQKFFQIFFRPL